MGATLTSGSSRFGRYTILRELGRGGIGAVHLAKKDGASELCVLKQLLVEHESNSNLERRFRREAHLSAYLDHPNIARILDAGSEEGVFYIAFELIAGQTLTKLLGRLQDRQEWLTAEMSLRIALEVLDGLVSAHGCTDPEGRPLGLVHRDLSPNNVMLSYAGAVKIIDFGLAAARIDDFKTAVGQLVGTIRYFSPEQAVAKGVDQRSDLYTVAVVLYEMLTARRLVVKGSTKEMLANVMLHRPQHLTQVVPGLPEGLALVLDKALQKDAGRRFQTAREMRDALRGVAGIGPCGRGELAGLLERLFPEEREDWRALERRGRELIEAEAISAAHSEETAYGTRTAAPEELLAGQTRTAAPEELLSQVKPSFEERTLPLVPMPAVVPIVPIASVAPAPMPVLQAGLHSHGPQRALLVLVAALLALIMVAVAYAVMRKTEEPAVIEPLPAASPTVVPRSEPRVEATEAPPPVETLPPERVERVEPVRPPPREKAARREPVVEKPPQPERRFAALEKMLERLKQAPSDGALMLELHRQIKKAAEPLPEADRRAIQIDIDAGLRGGDVDAIAKALKRLNDAAARP